MQSEEHRVYFNKEFLKNSLTYDLGRSEEDLEVTQRYERELQSDPVKRIREGQLTENIRKIV